MGAVGFFPSHVWGWGLVGFLVWAVFWVVLGWEQRFFCCKTMLDGMGQDGRYIVGKEQIARCCVHVLSLGVLM